MFTTVWAPAVHTKVTATTVADCASAKLLATGTRFMLAWHYTDFTTVFLDE